jgi:hypothetical protein
MSSGLGGDRGFEVWTGEDVGVEVVAKDDL